MPRLLLCRPFRVFASVSALSAFALSACTVPNDAADTGESDESSSADDSTEGSTTQDGSETGSTDTTTSETDTGMDVPDAPTLQLAFEPIRQFHFTWAAVDGADSYELHFASDEDAELELVVDGLTELEYSVEVPLHRRAGSVYQLSACNAVGCTPSEALVIDDPMLGAMGYFKSESVDQDDRYGAAVALSGDGLTLAVGVPFEDSDPTAFRPSPHDDSTLDAGAVYIYRKGAVGWALSQFLKAPGPALTAHWGEALALSDDGAVLVVGSPADASGQGYPDTDPTEIVAPFAGAAHVFRLGDEGYTFDTYLKATNPGSQDLFGTTLAISGDGQWIVVGAPEEDSSAGPLDGSVTNDDALDSGAAYVFQDVDGTWTFSAFLKAHNAGAEDLFASSLAVSADGSMVVVGAPQEDSSATAPFEPDDEAAQQSGAAYVFRLDPQEWALEQYLKPTNTRPDYNFGTAVDVSADGSFIVVGCPGDDADGMPTGTLPPEPAPPEISSAGSVFGFTRPGFVWEATAYFKAFITTPDDRYGTAVALSADGSLLVVGQTADEAANAGVGQELTLGNLNDAGAAYTYERNGDDSWTARTNLKSRHPAQGGFFTADLEVSNDGNLIVIGEPGENGSGTGVSADPSVLETEATGAVHMF